jgi:MscS family membrane protein
MRHKHLLKWFAAIAVCGVLVCVVGASGSADGDASSAVDQDRSKTAPDGADGKTASWDQFQLRWNEFWTDTFWARNWPYRWLFFLVAIFLGLVAAKIGAAVLARFAGRFEKRGWAVRADVVKDLVGPGKLALLAVGLSLGYGGLDRTLMSGTVTTVCGQCLLLLYTIAVFWYAFNLVSVVELTLRRLTAKTESTLDDQLVPLIRKALRILLVVMAVIFVVDSVFQRDVFALVAAVGVLGLPLGFAAQDTLKNVFGSIIILFNRPFQVGERIL